MKKLTSSIPFTGTPEQEAKLNEVMKAYADQPGALMPVMQKAQEIYGYLPIEVQQMIAKGMGVSTEEVYGISTFYAQFALSPKGKYTISVCLGTACYVKGAQGLVDRLKTLIGIEEGQCSPDGKFSLEACRCVGACGLAPVMTINEDVYGRLKPEEVDAILAKYN